MKAPAHRSPVATVLLFFASGAALTAGAIGIARWLGPPLVYDLGRDGARGAIGAANAAARDLGTSAGEGFASGMARFQQAAELVSGAAEYQRGSYRW